MHTGTDAPTIGSDNGSQGGRLGDKSPGFTNSADSHDLKISKTVSGNQASKDKVFAITVNIANALPDASYTVSIAPDEDDATQDGHAPATSATNAATIADNAGKTNVTSITAGNDGTASQTFYLADGDNVVIRGLPTGATYTVTENAEDYKSASEDTSGTMSANHHAAFTNTRQGTIPTGILIPIAGGVAIVGGAGLGLAANKRRKEEEE